MDETKLAPSLLDRIRQPRALEARAPLIPVIIQYCAGVYRSHIIRRGIRARYIFRLTPTVATTATGAEILALTDDDDIEFIWLDEEVHTCVDQSVPAIGVSTVWDAGYRGEGVKVAVVDTGIDQGHPDLAGRVAAGYSVVGADFQDDNGHGTHVAGIVAGTGSCSGGQYVGVAPGASLYVAKVLDASGGGAMSGVMAGIEWAVGQGVNVINLSLAGSGSSDGRDALSATCDAAAAQGVIICVAAGNGGPDDRTIGSPGAAAGAITIGAIDRADRIVDFSSRGPTADERIKPDVCLPGVDIVSLRAAGTSAGEPVDAWYTALSGTSMATPHATGIVALLCQACPDLTPEQARQALVSSAVDLGADPNAQGAGSARADRALAGVQAMEPAAPEPEEPVSKGCLPTFLVPWLGR